MMIRLRACIVVLALALVHSHALAQDDAQEGVGNESNPLGEPRAKTMLLIGPVAAINSNSHTGGFRIINDVSCPKFESGSGWGYMVGISAEVQRWASWSLIPRVMFESRPAVFTEELDDAKVLLPDQTTVVTQEVKAYSTIDYKLLIAELMYKQEIIGPGATFSLGVAAGPAFGWVLDAKIRQTLDLEQPLNAKFLNPENRPSENFGRRLIYADNDQIPGQKSFRFTLKGGLVAEIGLFDNEWMLSPGIYYDYGLSHVTANENWNVNSFIFQIDLRHAL